MTIKEQIKAIIESYGGGQYANESEAMDLAGKIISTLIESLPEEKEYVDHNLLWGDTDYSSNAVRYGINVCREQFLTNLY